MKSVLCFVVTEIPASEEVQMIITDVTASPLPSITHGSWAQDFSLTSFSHQLWGSGFLLWHSSSYSSTLKRDGVNLVKMWGLQHFPLQGP